MLFRCTFFLALLSYALGAAPEQISLSYGSSPSEVVVTWAVPGGDAKGAVVQYGASPSSLTSSSDATGSTYTIKTYTSPMLYKSTITGLTEGNKLYYYRVGSESGGFSDTFSFKSHPGVGKDGVTFHVVGDLGQTSNTVSTLQEVLDNEKALTDSLSGGIVSMGDLSYANGDQPLWDTFGNMKQFASELIPFSTTLGNHEWFDDSSYAFTAYKARFENPTVNGKKELYYSFDSGLVHWVMVAGYCSEMRSTSTQPCLAAGSPQLEWLEADLKSVDKSLTPWTFVVFHQPYVNSNTAHSMSTEGAPMQAAIEDVLFEAKVDMVFSGHVHAYERSCQVYKYKCTAGAPYYITIGDGGNAEGLAATWVNPQPEWSAFRQASYGHGELFVANSTHTSWAWHQNQDLSPVVADQFWLIKGQSSFLQGSSHGVTGEPHFAENERGARAIAFNNEAVTRRKRGEQLTTSAV